MSAFAVVSVILALDRPLPDGAEQTEALDEGEGGDFCNFRLLDQSEKVANNLPEVNRLKVISNGRSPNIIGQVYSKFWTYQKAEYTM